jgi:hypothetical protein
MARLFASCTVLDHIVNRGDLLLAVLESNRNEPINSAWFRLCIWRPEPAVFLPGDGAMENPRGLRRGPFPDLYLLLYRVR